MQDYFYITTAIDYPNGAPHMGHAYEKIVTDAYARWYRAQGMDTYFLTGTDENGQKLAKSAEDAGKSTQQFVDENAQIFRKLCKDLNISENDFIRTTEERHIKVVHEIWEKLSKNGDIFFDRYSGLYCLSCEAFYTETQAPDGQCPEHHSKLELLEEEGFFFKMSKYQDWIRDYLARNASFVSPDAARNEIVARLNAEPLKDLSISRPNKGWGIPVPGNAKFVIYTWFDALINYYSAVAHTPKEHYWPASLHVIGKDIGWFHTVIWPTMLHAAGIAQPKQVYIHGMVLAEDGRKMSKSLNNGVDPFEVLKTYPVDSFRYFILRSIPSGGNGKFSLKDLNQRHTSELGNDYGNLLMRVVKLARKRLGDSIASSAESVTLGAEFNFDGVFADMKKLMDAREHNKALDRLWLELNKVNAFINAKAPWAIKDGDPAFAAVVHAALQALYSASVLLLPFIPHSARSALGALGFADVDLKAYSQKSVAKLAFALSDPQVLFPRIV